MLISVMRICATEFFKKYLTYLQIYSPKKFEGQNLLFLTMLMHIFNLFALLLLFTAMIFYVLVILLPLVTNLTIRF